MVFDGRGEPYFLAPSRSQSCLLRCLPFSLSCPNSLHFLLSLLSSSYLLLTVGQGYEALCFICAQGSPGDGANVFFPGLGMPLGDVQPTAPAVDSNISTPRLLSTSVGQILGPAGSWPPPASPTAPPEPGPEAGESVSALALRLSHGTCLQKKGRKEEPWPYSQSRA